VPGTLYLIPTVLAEDTAAAVLPAQVRDCVAGLDLFLVEELRTARRFVKALCPEKVIESLTFTPLHKDSTDTEVLQALKPVMEGRSAGIISEAGCPGIADPGAEAVRIAHTKGIKVVPLVGPSSILLALMGSGFSGQQFAFHGYLPIERGARTAAIKALEKEMLAKDQTQILMETPYRNNQMLEDLLKTLQPNTRLCLAANLTSPQEILQTKPVNEWRKQAPDLHKQPALFLIYR
jgi:16S rRNA (cytidine1402-2'-O)-methyltransferase